MRRSTPTCRSATTWSSLPTSITLITDRPSRCGARNSTTRPDRFHITPHKRTPPSEIIFHYPLAAAIADKLVKTPVLVGRKDDRTDPQTKLLDGIRLLEWKDLAVQRWCQDTGATPVLPIMLVIAPSIAEAEEIELILSDPSFAGGRYADRVLTVHSNKPDEALAQLDHLEEPDNPYRVVISVGMLKEGWDVKNVYIIASLRASVSEILTEQTLGRGLRLPFGHYTDVEFLDTLEVLGHERYEDLLRKAGVLNEQFIDYRSRAVLRRNAMGQLVPTTETTPVHAAIATIETITPSPSPPETPSDAGTAVIQSLEGHTEQAEQQVAGLNVKLVPRPELPKLRIPRLKMTMVTSSFSLADITELEPFRRLGESLAADPVGNLRRVTLSARIVSTPDGLRHTELVTAGAIDQIPSPASLFPLEELQQQLLQRVLAAPAVPARANQVHPATQIVEAFLRGLGADAEKILSGYMDRAAGGLVQLVTEEQRVFAAKPSYEDVVELTEFNKVRIGRPETSRDRFGTFKRGIGYAAYQKSLYAQDWFDSSTERDVANILEEEPVITLWARLQVGDLPILWAGARSYNPDLSSLIRRIRTGSLRSRWPKRWPAKTCRRSATPHDVGPIMSVRMSLWARSGAICWSQRPTSAPQRAPGRRSRRWGGCSSLEGDTNSIVEVNVSARMDTNNCYHP